MSAQEHKVLVSYRREMRSNLAIDGMLSFNSLVHAALQTYNTNQQLKISPDAVWLAILAQLNIYLNSQAGLRQRFFAEGDVGQYLVRDLRPPITNDVEIDLPLLDEPKDETPSRVVEALENFAKDEALPNLVIPQFSTSGGNDRAIAALLFLGTVPSTADDVPTIDSAPSTADDVPTTGPALSKTGKPPPADLAASTAQKRRATDLTPPTAKKQRVTDLLPSTTGKRSAANFTPTMAEIMDAACDPFYKKLGIKQGIDFDTMVESRDKQDENRGGWITQWFSNTNLPRADANTKVGPDWCLAEVVLLGTVSDYEKMLEQLDALLQLLGGGETLDQLGRLLQPVLWGILASILEPRSADVKYFWGDMTRVSEGPGRCIEVAGWITAFCYLSVDGKPQPCVRAAQNGSYFLKYVLYPCLPVESVPPALATVPFNFARGKKFRCFAAAGLLYIRNAEHGAGYLRAHPGAPNECISPESLWFLWNEDAFLEGR